MDLEKILPDLKDDVYDGLQEILKAAKADLSDLLPEVKEIASAMASYGAKYAIGDEGAGEILKIVRLRAGLVMATIMHRESKALADAWYIGVEVALTILGKVLKRVAL